MRAPATEFRVQAELVFTSIQVKQCLFYSISSISFVLIFCFFKMSSCGVCLKGFSGNKLKLTCDDCKCEFHAACFKYSKADVDCLSAEGLKWRCKDCAATRRKSMRFEAAAAEGKLSLEDIMKVVTEIRDSQKSYEKSFNDTCESLETQLMENTKALTDQKDQNEQLLHLIETISTENKQLKTKVRMLEDRLEDMEQYSRSNCVEIQGIPVTPTESVMNIVKDVGKALDLTISDSMVDACHRLGVRQNSDNPPGIIVKFVRRLDKEDFLQKRRVKRTLSTRHIGRTDDRPIYINESLSPARRRLHAMARRYQREKSFKFLWVRNGKIFLRKEENAPVKVVSREEDLE